MVNNYEEYDYNPSYVPKYSHLVKMKTDISESPVEKKYNFTYTQDKKAYTNTKI